MIINYILKKYDILMKEKIIIFNSFEDLLITKLFNDINSMSSETKTIFEKSKLFKINMPENIRDKLLINIKKYYSLKNSIICF